MILLGDIENIAQKSILVCSAISMIASFIVPFLPKVPKGDKR